MTSLQNALKLAQLDYPSTDVDRTVAYFQDVLDLPLLFRAGPLAFCALGGVRLYIRPAQDASDLARASILYLQTANLDETLADLERRGADVRVRPRPIAEMPDHVLWMAFIGEPDDRLIGIMEERRRDRGVAGN